MPDAAASEPAPAQDGQAAPAAPQASCALPFEAGNCRALFPVFYFNAASGKCEPANYGGCGGNANRFQTQAECEAACVKR